MSKSAQRQFAQLLDAIKQGDDSARERLWVLVYEELKGMARRHVAKDRTAQKRRPTSLVHETYMRLTVNDGRGWESQKHFFAAAAQAMRHIYVDDVRKRNRLKRGGADADVALSFDPSELTRDTAEVLAVDEALDDLEELHPRKGVVVKLRYFAGLTVDQTADALDVSPRTVDKDWRFARSWLHRALSDSGK